MTNIEQNRLRREIISEKAELRKVALSEVKNLTPEEALPILISSLESIIVLITFIHKNGEYVQQIFLRLR